MRFWSSSALLSGARAPARTAASRAASNSADSGSTPRSRNSGWSARPFVGARVHRAETPGVVVDDARAAIEREDDVVVRFAFSPARGGTAATSVCPPRSTRNEPDMPRCMMSVSPPSSAASRYLARRVKASILRPVSRSAKRSGKGTRRSPPPRLDPRRSACPPSRARGRAAPSRLRAAQASAWSRITARKAAPYFCSLAAPTPWIAARSSSVRGRSLRHLDQAAVGKDDIGRLVLRAAPSRRAAPSAPPEDRRRRRPARRAGAFRGAASWRRRPRAARTAPRRAAPFAPPR